MIVRSCCGFLTPSLLLTFPKGVWCLLLGTLSLWSVPTLATDLFIRDTPARCSTPALSQLKRHRIVPGETLPQIARQYNLIPATLLGMNPNLRQPNLPVGEEIVIPPYNGIQIEAPPGSTWRELAELYDVGADVIFEANGCQPQPQMVFIPGVNWSPGGLPQAAVELLSAYPLPSAGEIVLTYGWQLHPVLEQVIFHSGLDIVATVGTPVLSVGMGTVAFAGQRGNYGNVVVVNHASGKQTRYAHLSEIAVEAGQALQPGTIIGKVGQTGKPDMTQPHLHFEIRYNSPLGWVAENPNPYFTNP